MKIGELHLCLFALYYLVLPFALHAQVPEWEDPVQLDLSSGNTAESSFSDGFGQHIAVSGNSDSRHYLIKNDGATLFSSSTLGDNGHSLSAVTSFGSQVTFVGYHHVGTGHQVIRLWRSSDGGEHWPGSAAEYDPATDFSNQLITALDAYEDGNGVHIVWEASSEIYYVLYDPISLDFILPKRVTDLNPGTGLRPKIVTSGSKAHVTFMRTDLSPSRASTRDLNFAADPPEWESSYENVAITQHASDGIQYENIVRRGDTLHIISYEYISGGPHWIHASKRHINNSSWPSSTVLDSFNIGDFNGKRSLTTLGDTIYGSFPSWIGGKLRQLVYKPATGWSTSEVTETGSGPYKDQTISSSRTGVYFYYHLNGNSVWMKRKVYPLSGHITENMFFTGKNWITDDLTIDAGVTVTLKAGSTTYVSDNKKLIVANGGTLLKERGSQVIFGSGATFKITTTLLDQWNMTGIPAVLSDFTASVVYPTKTSTVYEYNAGYSAVTQLSNDRGFYLRFSGAQPHDYEGGFIDTMAMNAYNGWNIIGSISSPINVADVFSDPVNHIITPFYKFDGGYTAVSTLVPGAGYWVRTDAAGKIILTLRNIQTGSRGVPGPLSKLNDDEPLSLDTYDQFTVTDAAGGRQHLYVRNAVLAGTTENYEMPPALPDNSFDVRFSPGDYLRSITPDSQGIDLSIALNAVAYPAELTWEINPENNLAYTLPEGGRGLSKGNSLSRSKRMVLQSRGNGFVHFNVSNRKAQADELPTQFSLQQNYPNPFNPSTVISYDLPMDVHLSLKVYDILGREVMTLVNGVVEAGYHQSILNASNLASGLYFYRLQAGTYSSVKKLMLLK